MVAPVLRFIDVGYNANVTIEVSMLVCVSGNFRRFEKPSVRPQLKFSFLRVARSWFSIK